MYFEKWNESETGIVLVVPSKIISFVTYGTANAMAALKLGFDCCKMQNVKCIRLFTSSHFCHFLCRLQSIWFIVFSVGKANRTRTFCRAALFVEPFVRLFFFRFFFAFYLCRFRFVCFVNDRQCELHTKNEEKKKPEHEIGRRKRGRK